ncbi:integrator complex assembly factor BRAT1 [Pholidichthys leucotaenia]
MDGECESLLPRVCEVLAAPGGSLPDDTSLEKLMDWFTEITKTGVPLLEAFPCLLEFISAMVYSTSSAPSILSFTVKLTGLMVSTESGFNVLQECSVLDQIFNVQRWQEVGLWEDPCIRIGWVQGLGTMMQHPKALSFFVQKDFIGSLLQLQTDTSLFVASAANQMLADVLVLCQSVSLKECNDTQKEEEHLISSLDTHQDYSGLVMTVSEYLRKSLVVPRGHAQLHQTMQILKLLALLLAQTRPPLREDLQQAVSGCLEKLVMANFSQLILPLMDVLLAAYSCDTDGNVPDGHFTRLLSLVLHIKHPADLIRAAAAFLCRGCRDHIHAAWCATLLLLPIDIITGQTLVGTNAADEYRLSILEQLKSKTSCISLICVCLTNVPQISQTAPNCLPCPVVSVVSAVLSLLRLCSGDLSYSSAGCSEVFRNVIGTGKVQKCALDALAALSTNRGVKVLLVEVFTVLIHYVDNPDSDPTVLHKSYQTLVKWMSVCSDVSSITDQHRQELITVVKKRVCDMRWEVRDSTVEFLGQLAAVHVSPSSNASEALLGCTTPLLKEALQDPESYVRASAIKALAQTLVCSWQEGAAVTQEQTEIVTRLLEILSQDTEGFSRRAVVQFFITWFSSRSSSPPPSSHTSSLLMRSVQSVVLRASVDLDWEVKVHTLELAELLLDQALSGHHGYSEASGSHPGQKHPYAVIPAPVHTPHTHMRAHSQDAETDEVGMLDSLVEQGVVAALLSGLVDCDRPVGLKACRLLIKLRDTVCPLSLEAPNPTVARVSCKLPGQGWAQEVRKILASNNQATETGLIAHGSINGADVDDSEEPGGGDGGAVCVSVCGALRSLGLEERLDILTQSSDHVQNSPLSLLQDILTASGVHVHADSELDQEVIVDCY